MHGLRNCLGIALTVICFGIAAFGQDQSVSINGPILGFVQDRGGAAIQPIRGVLGASAVGQPLELGSEIRNAIVSPKHDYALANRSETGEAVLVRLGVDSVAMSPLDGVHAGSGQIAISPTGSAAAFFGRDRVLQSIV